jgi:hypothetical protein
MGKLSTRQSVKNQRPRRRSDAAPTQVAAVRAVHGHDVALWAEVLGSEAAEPTIPITLPPPGEAAMDGNAELAFFDRGVSLRRAALIDDNDTFHDLDAAALPRARRGSALRRRSLQALFATVMAAAAAVLLLGASKSPLRSQLSPAATRAVSTEASMTACGKAERHDKRSAAASKAPPHERRR